MAHHKMSQVCFFLVVLLVVMSFVHVHGDDSDSSDSTGIFELCVQRNLPSGYSVDDGRQEKDVEERGLTACRSEVDNYCPTDRSLWGNYLKSSKHELLLCLAQNEELLSPQCFNEVSSSATFQCAADARRLCSRDLHDDNYSVIACLEWHATHIPENWRFVEPQDYSITDKCRRALNDRRARDDQPPLEVTNDEYPADIFLCVADACSLCPRVLHEKQSVISCLESQAKYTADKCRRALNAAERREQEPWRKPPTPKDESADRERKYPPRSPAYDESGDSERISEVSGASNSRALPLWALIALVGVSAAFVCMTVVVLLVKHRRRQREAVLEAANSLTLPSTDVRAPQSVRLTQFEMPYHRMDEVQLA